MDMECGAPPGLPESCAGPLAAPRCAVVQLGLSGVEPAVPQPSYEHVDAIQFASNPSRARGVEGARRGGARTASFSRVLRAPCALLPFWARAAAQRRSDVLGKRLWERVPIGQRLVCRCVRAWRSFVKRSRVRCLRGVPARASAVL